MFRTVQHVAIVGFAAALGANVRADVIDAHIAAVGGTEALAKIKTMQRKGNIAIEGEFGQFDGTRREAIINGKKAYTATDFGAFASQSGWNGEIGWDKNAGQEPKEIEGDELETLKLSAGIDPLAAIKHQYGQAAFKLAGDQELDGRTYDAVDIVDTGWTFFLDKQTKLIAAMITKRNDPNLGGELVLKIAYDDYQAVEGVQLPHKTVTDIADGRAVMTTTYTETTVNQPINDTLFDWPTE